MSGIRFILLGYWFAASSIVEAQEPAVLFYRAVNLNGPALVIDEHSWDASDAPNLRIEGGAFDKQGVALKPITDANRAKMIRSSRWGRTIATGYIANARRFGSRVDDYPQHLTIEDTVDNLGRTFLGTSINCARCHNHKFDPIPTEDYYSLYGIFHST